jgi:hypothetical protein
MGPVFGDIILDIPALVGTYQHCGAQHLQRYLNEFDFRYPNRKALGINDEGAQRCIRQASHRSND